MLWCLLPEWLQYIEQYKKDVEGNIKEKEMENARASIKTINQVVFKCESNSFWSDL